MLIDRLYDFPGTVPRERISFISYIVLRMEKSYELDASLYTSEIAETESRFYRRNIVCVRLMVAVRAPLYNIAKIVFEN